MTTLYLPLSVTVKLFSSDSSSHVQFPSVLAQLSLTSPQVAVSQLVSSSFSQVMLKASVMPNCINALSKSPHRKICGIELLSLEQVTVSP